MLGAGMFELPRPPFEEFERITTVMYKTRKDVTAAESLILNDITLTSFNKTFFEDVFLMDFYIFLRFYFKIKYHHYNLYAIYI